MSCARNGDESHFGSLGANSGAAAAGPTASRRPRTRTLRARSLSFDHALARSDCMPLLPTRRLENADRRLQSAAGRAEILGRPLRDFGVADHHQTDSTLPKAILRAAIPGSAPLQARQPLAD